MIVLANGVAIVLALIAIALHYYTVEQVLVLITGVLSVIGLLALALVAVIFAKIEDEDEHHD